MKCSHSTSEVSSVQTERSSPAASSAVPSVHFGSSSCSLWKSAPGAGTLSSPGVQPCTPARRNAAPRSPCEISSDPRGRPRPRLYGCGHGATGRPSLSTRRADFVGLLSTTHNVTHKQVMMNVVLLASLCCRKRLISKSQHVKPTKVTVADILHQYININWILYMSR